MRKKKEKWVLLRNGADYDTLSQVMSICDNYNIDYNLIDPSQPEKSIGLYMWNI